VVVVLVDKELQTVLTELIRQHSVLRLQAAVVAVDKTQKAMTVVQVVAAAQTVKVLTKML
jgi:ribosomal protein L29